MGKAQQQSAKFKRYQRAVKEAEQLVASPFEVPHIKNVAREFLGFVTRHPCCKKCRQIEATCAHVKETL